MKSLSQNLMDEIFDQIVDEDPEILELFEKILPKEDLLKDIPLPEKIEYSDLLYIAMLQQTPNFMAALSHFTKIQLRKPL